MDVDVTATTPEASKRILAFDIMRGLFLIIILINHIELYPSGYDYFTGRGRLLVSAAEGFFFMSGLLVGLVYRRRLSRGMGFVFKKMWRRAAELYIGSVLLTLLFTAAAVFLNHPSIKDGLFTVIDWPKIVKETVLMRYGFGWADFLDRFAILMFLAPFGFYLLAKRKWWLLLAISFLGWTQRGNGFTLSWQLIFAMGMIIGFHWQQLVDWWRSKSLKFRRMTKRSFVSVAGITFLLSYISVYILSELNTHWNSLSAGLQTFTFHWNSVNAWVWLYAQKWTMGPVRILLFMIWFWALFFLIQKYQRPINRFSRGYVELLGRNSLFVYIAHAFIVFIFKLFIPYGTQLVANFLITTAALITLVGVTVIYKRFSWSGGSIRYHSKPAVIAAK
jgi:hypothetical protein